MNNDEIKDIMMNAGGDMCNKVRAVIKEHDKRKNDIT